MYITQLLQIAPAAAIFMVMFIAVLGAVFGSFVNCIAWRKVHGESAMRGRSHCPHCNHDLSAGDLIPVVSWISLRGRCRYCGGRIGVRYVASELVCGISFVIIACCYGVTIQGIALCALVCVLLALSLTDLEARRIPNTFILTGIIIWAVLYVLALLSYVGVLPQIYAGFCTMGVMESAGANPFFDAECVQLGSLFLGLVGGNAPLAVLLDSLVGGFGISLLMLGCAMLFDRLTGKHSLGAGDVKLFFVTGLYLGLAGNLLNLLLACILGAIFGIVFNHANGEGKSAAFPFGPAIAVSTVACLIFGPAAIGAYLGLFRF